MRQAQGCLLARADRDVLKCVPLIFLQTDHGDVESQANRREE